jgi:hypothetical protein
MVVSTDTIYRPVNVQKLLIREPKGLRSEDLPQVAVAGGLQRRSRLEAGVSKCYRSCVQPVSLRMSA